MKQLTDKQLTDKQQRFVEEYCVDFNATQASIRAGYSERTARQIGSENLSKPDISQAIEARLDALSMTAAEATYRMSQWGRGTIGRFMRRTGQGELVLDLGTDEATEHLYLVKKLKQEEYAEDIPGLDDEQRIVKKTEIELYDAMGAVKEIMRARGLFQQQVDITSDGEPITNVSITIHGDTIHGDNS